jgi:hypothetical protein
MHKSIVFALALLAAGAGAAQERRPDPRDPKAQAPRVEFRSALEGYRRFAAEQELAGWRKANDQVRAAGGHAGKPRPGERK